MMPEYNDDNISRHRRSNEELSLHSEDHPRIDRPVLSVIFDNFDQILLVTGALGRYQWAYMLVMQVSIILLASNYAFMPFATYEPTVHCHLDNGSVLELNRSHIKESFCLAYNEGTCRNLTWTAPFVTIIEQWELICDLDHVPQLINSVQMSGTLIAMALSGLLSDQFGRKRVFLPCLLLFVTATMLGVSATSWQMLIVCRFFVGGLISATTSLKFVWGMEMTDEKNNVAMNLSNMWHFGYMVAALIGYLTADWKMYLIVLSIIGLPLIVIYTFFHESARWLIQQGELEKNLSRIGSLNRVDKFHMNSANLVRIPVDHKDGHRKGCFSTIQTLFSHRQLVIYTLTMGLLVFAVSVSVNIYIFQVSQLAGSPFFKFFLYGLLRLFIVPVIYLSTLIHWFGRRHLVLLPLLLVIVCFISVIIVRMSTPSNETLDFYALLTGAVVCNCLWTGIGQND